jgi:hypothetical protein
MGLMSLEDKVPTESTYYKFFAAICEYKENTVLGLRSLTAEAAS